MDNYVKGYVADCKEQSYIRAERGKDEQRIESESKASTSFSGIL